MTEQVGDELIYEGDCIRYGVDFCPLLPENDPRIIELSQGEIEYVGYPKDHRDRGGMKRFLVGTTACWRGYIATWEVKDGKLYLVEIVGRYKMVENEPVFAEWFFGGIRVPRRKGELHLLIEKGIVVNVAEFNK